MQKWHVFVVVVVFNLDVRDTLEIGERDRRYALRLPVAASLQWLSDAS